MSDWILCSERLPKLVRNESEQLLFSTMSDYCLVTARTSSGKKIVTQAALTQKGTWFPLTSIGLEVIAWMPSPSPYEKDENKEDKYMSNLKLSPPWVIYVNKIAALFGKDPAIKIQYDDDAKELKLFIDGDRKYEAISALLPSEENFGGTVLKITTVPSNLKAENDFLSLIKDAFQDNPILDHISTIEMPFGDVNYVSFKKEVVQFFNDSTADEHGICSTLYQDIAEEIFDDAAENMVYFCTNVDSKL